MCQSSPGHVDTQSTWASKEHGRTLSNVVRVCLLVRRTFFCSMRARVRRAARAAYELYRTGRILGTEARKLSVPPFLLGTVLAG
jgi:hypothetical protein